MNVQKLTSGILLLLLISVSAHAGGLRTQLGEIVVENLQIGQTYNLIRLANLNLKVTNTSQYPVRLQMDVLTPNESELRHQAEPVPDLSWIKLTCDSFDLDAGQQAVSDIIISIPDEEQYLGKRYQFMIWSHTVPGADGSIFLATGLKSRIVFTTDTVRADLSPDFDKVSGNAGFSVSPSELHLNSVPLGSRYDMTEACGAALVIQNPTDQVLTVRLYSEPVSSSFASIDTGWEDTPDPGYLTFDKNEIKIPPREERSANIYLNIPDQAQLRGKRLMFLVTARDETGPVNTGVYVRVYVTLKQ